jgi:hypothetical protein
MARLYALCAVLYAISFFNLLQYIFRGREGARRSSIEMDLGVSGHRKFDILHHLPGI